MTGLPIRKMKPAPYQSRWMNFEFGENQGIILKKNSNLNRKGKSCIDIINIMLMPKKYIMVEMKRP